MKADLAAGIMRILRERDLSGARAAGLAGVTEADISRIRKADLERAGLKAGQQARIRIEATPEPVDLAHLTTFASGRADTSERIRHAVGEALDARHARRTGER